MIMKNAWLASELGNKVEELGFREEYKMNDILELKAKALTAAVEAKTPSETAKSVGAFLGRILEPIPAICEVATNLVDVIGYPLEVIRTKQLNNIANIGVNFEQEIINRKIEQPKQLPMNCITMINSASLEEDEEMQKR